MAKKGKKKYLLPSKGKKKKKTETAGFEPAEYKVTNRKMGVTFVEAAPDLAFSPYAFIPSLANSAALQARPFKRGCV